MIYRKLMLCLIVTMIGSAVYAQKGIGTNSPKDAAALDIESTNRGLLIPRVGLKDVTKQTINGATAVAGRNPNAEESLLIYNSGGSGNVSAKGFYYWSGSVNGWLRLLTSDGGGDLKDAGGDGIKYNTSTKKLDVDLPTSNPGLRIASSKLDVKAGDGITLDGDGVNVDLATSNDGLKFSTTGGSGKLSVDAGNGIDLATNNKVEVKGHDGIAVDGNGVKADINTAAGLEFTGSTAGSRKVGINEGNGLTYASGSLVVKPKSNGGIAVDGDGVAVDSGNGIEIPTSGSGVAGKVRVKADDGIVVGGDGVSVKGDDGIVVSSDGVKVDIEADKGLELTNTDGSGKLRVEAGNGIKVSSSGVEVDLPTANPGLKIASAKLDVKYGNGVAPSGSGVAVDLATNPGLELAGSSGSGDGRAQLKVKPNNTKGIIVESAGVGLNAESGLSFDASDSNKLKLGGTLDRPTTITTTNTNKLTINSASGANVQITGLPNGKPADNKMLVTDASGALKVVNRSNNINVLTDDTTLTLDHDTVIVENTDTSTASKTITITLPKADNGNTNANNVGKRYVIKRGVSGVSGIDAKWILKLKIAKGSSKQHFLDGVDLSTTGKSISNNYRAITVQSSGTTWYVIGSI